MEYEEFVPYVGFTKNTKPTIVQEQDVNSYNSTCADLKSVIHTADIPDDEISILRAKLKQSEALNKKLLGLIAR